MKCPHCRTAFHYEGHEYPIGNDADGGWQLDWCTCPACLRFVITLNKYHVFRGTIVGSTPEVTVLCHPKAALRPAPPPEVPRPYAKDYTEACLVISDSAKASAALSRRCLQNILRDVAKAKPSDLSNEIQEIIDSGKLPAHLADSIDAIRNIGNFAAHPIKSKSSGEIVDVEPGEADWNLDVLEGLFDFYFVQPALSRKRRDALNKKLADAGKPNMKAAVTTP
jgi:hypothetical protein